MAKGRVIALKFAGRNLTAPPEGYTSRTEACVKRWLSRLPKPLDSPPDDVQTIHDGFDSEVDLDSLDDMRHSIEGDEKPQEVEGDQTLSDVVGSVVDGPVKQEPTSQQNNSVPASPDTRSGSSAGGDSAVHSSKGAPGSNGGEEDADSTSVPASEKLVHIQDDKGGLQVAAPTVDSSAVEIGMERYLGMAEASNIDRESILKEALRLAVSDRINTRMAHMADAAKLAEQDKQAEDKALEHQAVVEANTALQQEVGDLKRKQHWDQLKAREDAFCAQQQLEAGHTALKDAIATMELRISKLTAQGQETLKEKRDLEVKLAAASHDATKLRSDVAVLEQQLAAKAVECTALRAELKDNVHRWEQESLQRMETEQQLQSTKVEMKAAVAEGKKATKEASLKGRAHETAMRELMSCRTRHRSLQSAKAALEPEETCTAAASSPARGVQSKKLTSQSGTPTKRPLADKNRSDTTAAHDEANPGVPAADCGSSKEQAGADSAVMPERASPQMDSNENLGHPTDGQGSASESTSTVSHSAPHQRKKSKPDAQALRLQEQLLHQAFSTAPPALKVLKLALRCIIVTQPGGEEAASGLAAKMSPHYRTLTCVVTDTGCSAAAEESHIACVDEHTLQVLLPICHKALFVNLQPALASELQNRAREQKLPAATVTTAERSCIEADEASESTHDRCSILATVEFVPDCTDSGTKRSEISWKAAVEKIQYWIGIPDSILQCITAGSLKSLHKGDGTNRFKLQPAQRALLDLSTFSKTGATSFTLQSSSTHSVAGGKEATAGETELEPLDGLEVPHCTAIANAAQLARHLLMHNRCITQLNLSSINISEQVSCMLADAMLRSCSSQIETVVLSKAPLPAGRLIGKISTKTQCQPDSASAEVSSMTAVSLPATITDIDLAFMTELLERTPQSTLSSLAVAGPLSVSSKLLEGFAVAVAKLQNLKSLQGVLCDSLRVVNGLLCPTRVTAVHSRTPDCPLGTFGALVAAQLLTLSCKCPLNEQSPNSEVMNANTLDGVADMHCEFPRHGANMELQTVNLSGTELGGLGSERMASALGSASFCGSMHLQLACTAPARQGCKAWAVFINSHVASCLTALDLSSNNLDDTQMLELTHALGLCTQLESLNLSGNSIVCKGALALSQELLQNVPLRSLNLANNSLADRAGVAVAGLLLPSSACNFSCLQMSGNCSLGSSTAAKLAQVLPYTTSLKTLDLSRTQLNGQALPQLARALQANQTLVSLNISSCRIGVGEVRNLSAALDSNTSLQNLRISKNSIGDQGAAAIGTLIANISLTYINLSHSCIRTCGAQWLADALPRAQFLLHLDLSSNDIGDIGAAALIQTCGGLTRLELCCTDMSDFGLSSVASHLSANSAKIQLRSLNLSRNQFGDKAMDQLCAAISSNTQLQAINLSGCGLGSAAGRRLLHLIQSLNHSEAVSHRHHQLQDVSVSHNARMDSVIASSIKDSLASRPVQPGAGK